MTVETQTCTLYIGEDGILRGIYRAGTEETLAAARENVKAASDLCAGRKVPLLIDMRTMKSITAEARRYYGGSEPAKYSLAQALLVGSPVSRLIGNFFLGITSVRFPTRLFTSEPEALAWLKQSLEHAATRT